MLEKIKEMIALQLHLNAAEIKDDALFVEDLGADSLDLAEMLMNIEKELGICISDDDAADMRSVKDVADFCEKHSK